MTSDATTGLYKLAQDVLYQDLEGEAVFLHMDSGNYFGLDEIGSRAWQLLSENVDLQDVLKTLLNEYDTDAATLEADIRALIKSLTDENLIELA